MRADNRNHIGANWTGRTARTLEEAGLRGPITGHQKSEPLWKSALGVAILVLFVVGTMFVGNAAGF